MARSSDHIFLYPVESCAVLFEHLEAVKRLALDVENEENHTRDKIEALIVRYRALQAELAAFPCVGDIMPGLCGGIRSLLRSLTYPLSHIHDVTHPETCTRVFYPHETTVPRPYCFNSTIWAELIEC